MSVDRAGSSVRLLVGAVALDLGATLTAEGVETATQLAVLVDHGQGCHRGRPTLDVGCPS